MKRIIAILLVFLLLCPLIVFAAEEKPDISQFELPKPEAPVYLLFEAADRTATEGNDALYVVRKADMSVLELSAWESSDRDAFLETYGLYDFSIIMQYDTSLDGTDNWNHTSEWDSDYAAPGSSEAAGIFWIGSEMMEKQNIFDLYRCDPDGDRYSRLMDAVIRRDVPDGEHTFHNYYFDWENHSLYIRVRYYMQWQTLDGETVGDIQSKYSEWSEPAIFGKDGNGVIPEAPTTYEAPVISELQYVQPGKGSELGHLLYTQYTPEQVWMAGIYYEMTGDGYFDDLETQISLDDGPWQSYVTVNAGGDWCLWNGERTALYEEPPIEADSHIRLRIRFVGSHGPSPWSNVLELNDGGTQVVPTEPTQKPTEPAKPTEPPVEPAEDHCPLCGFCPVPFGLCIFLWLAIILAVLLVLIILIAVSKKRKKKEEKN